MDTSYSVLVVERTDLVRRTVKRTMTQSGYRVLEAADANEALAVVATPEMHIDLVLIGAIGSVEREQLGWEWPDVPQVGSLYAHPTGAGASEDSTLVEFSHR